MVPTFEGNQGGRHAEGPISGLSRSGAAMSTTDTTPHVSSTPPKGWRRVLVGTPLGWILAFAIAALGFYLFVNHTGHILAALPYLLLLACPLMHLFMHAGHGHHRGKRK